MWSRTSVLPMVANNFVMAGVMILGMSMDVSI
jgi:hypothetical protein